eukprot:COSAG01_NODE_638_length_14605_cov_46.266097_1_plen_37_part_00
MVVSVVADQHKLAPTAVTVAATRQSDDDEAFALARI